MILYKGWKDNTRSRKDNTRNWKDNTRNWKDNTRNWKDNTRSWKDSARKGFRDYNTYRETAKDADEAWSPSGGDIDSIIDGMITYGYGAGNIEGLKMEQRYDLAVALSTRFGIAPDLVAAKLGVSLLTVNKMIYSFNKKNH